MKGKVKSLLSSYGFITPESSEEEGEELKDLFFHKSGASLFYELSVGDVVQYEQTEGRKEGEMIATTVEKIEE